MPKIQRKHAKVFGVNSPLDRMAVIGSLRNGSPVYSKDPTELQSLANYEDGWPGIAIGNSSPPLEDMNSIQYVFAYQIAYLMQQGVAEWNAETTYYENSIVSDGLGNLLISLQDDNTGHSLTEGSWWCSYGGKIRVETGNTALSGEDDILLCEIAAGPEMIVTLPLCNSIPVGKQFTVKNRSIPAGGGFVRLTASGPNTIDGLTNIVIGPVFVDGPQESITVRNTGVDWIII